MIAGSQITQIHGLRRFANYTEEVLPLRTQSPRDVLGMPSAEKEENTEKSLQLVRKKRKGCTIAYLFWWEDGIIVCSIESNQPKT